MCEMDKVIGYDGIKQEMLRILDVMKNPEKYQRLGLSVPRGILLDGEPGVGKTLLAKAFVADSGRNAYIVRKNKPNGEFVNYIREIFDKAKENAPSVILLDDMDKYANEDYRHRDAEEYVTIQACMDGVKECDVFVVATSNDSQSLPDSLLRNGRFDKRYHMTFPKGEDAEKIISFFLSDKRVAADIDVEEIARFSEGFSCASLETVINTAGMYAAYEGKDSIDQCDVIRACLREIYNTPEVENELLPEATMRRAVHEAGHAVVAEILAPGSVNFASVVTNMRGIGGMVSRRKKEKSDSLRDIEKEIMIAQGGKGATELMLGEIDTGSNNDLHLVFDKVRRILDNLTAYSFDSWCHGNETSENVYTHLDSATGCEVSRYYLKTKQILIKNRRFLESFVEELTEKGTLSYKDIAKIKDKGMAQ